LICKHIIIKIKIPPVVISAYVDHPDDEDGVKMRMIEALKAKINDSITTRLNEFLTIQERTVNIPQCETCVALPPHLMSKVKMAKIGEIDIELY